MKHFFLIALIALIGNNAVAQTIVTNDYPAATEVTGEGAWCWFADPRALHYESPDGRIRKTYIGYIDIHGNIKATQLDWNTGNKEEVLIRSYFQPDDHNNPTFLALPDGRIMVFYSRHTDEPCFYYRITREPGDLTTLGKEKVIRTAQNTTYPSPCILGRDSTHIYLCWRGINWHPTIGRLLVPGNDDETNFDWGPYQIVQSTGARPYAKYTSDGEGRIYLAYTTGHPDNEQPNFLYLNYIDIETKELKDIQGNVLSHIPDEPHQVNKSCEYKEAHSDAVVASDNYRNWLWEVAICRDGAPAIARVRISDDKTEHEYFYTKWDGTAWQSTFLASGGGLFHQTPETERCYSGGMAIDKQRPDRIVCSVPEEGAHGRVYELKEFVVGGNGQVSSRLLTQDSEKNNSRPFFSLVPSGCAPELMWMNGDYYDWIVSSKRPLGYPTSIYAAVSMPEIKVDLKRGLVKSKGTLRPDTTITARVGEGTQAKKHTASKKKKREKSTVCSRQERRTTSIGSSASHSKATTRINLTADTAFTLSLTLNLKDAIPGGNIIVTGSSFTYALDPQTVRPYLIVNGSPCESNNIWGTADSWKQQERSTNGRWYTPEYFNVVNLTITYDDHSLRTYVNGLLDQSIPARGLTLKDAVLGTIAENPTGYAVYCRCLSSDEVKALIAQ